MTHTAPHPPRLMANILPNNSTPMEHAVASQVERLLALDVEQIRRLWDPWTCRLDMLPYLAWAMSVDVWYDDWDEYKKRSVVANAIKHHALKGTLSGLEVYAGLVGSTIVHATVPPAKVFSGRSLTRDEREAWLSRLPQVRVWRQYERGFRGNRLFLGGAKWPSFLSAPADAEHPEGHHRHFPQPNDAISRLRRRARWVEAGVETDCRVESFEAVFRVFKPGLLPHSFFAGPALSGIRKQPKRFLVPSTAYQRIVTIEPRSISSWRSSITPSLQAVTSEPEIVAIRSHEGKAVYSGRCFGGRYLLPSTAPYRLFERYAVNDGSLASKQRPVVQFMGVGRYGIKPKTAELKIEIRGKHSRWKAGEGIIGRKTKFWTPHDNTALDRTRHALVAAKRRTDQILLDTSTKPGFIAGLPFWAGDQSFIV